MPLINSGSNKARQENIHKEIEAGKPIKQAIAIGYSKQREEKAHHMSEHEHRHHERVQHEKRKYGKE